jgi:HD-like signal output (HDOD) protein
MEVTQHPENAIPVNNHQPDRGTEVAFQFVRALAAELSAGRVELPSFPEAVMRVRRVLSEPDSTAEKVVRVIGAEPALAARLLRIANSAFLNTSGKPIKDLRTAINRMGFNMVRSASMSFAMAQIRATPKLEPVKQDLQFIWERSVLVAAFAFVVARRCTRINPDEAMLTGLLHGIGKLYVFTRVVDHPELFRDASMMNQIVDDWHIEIAKAILENWGFGEATVQAVADQGDSDRCDVAEADLSDVILAAIVMASYQGNPVGLELALTPLPAALRLGLDDVNTAGIMRDFATEVAVIKSALSG